MINEKIIIETLENHTIYIANMQSCLAAITSLIEAHLPDLSPEQKEILKKNAENMNSLSGHIEAEGVRLKSLSKGL